VTQTFLFSFSTPMMYKLELAKFVMYLPSNSRIPAISADNSGFPLKNIKYILLLSIISYYDHMDSVDPCLGQPPYRLEG
jgi:hypothetical protein